MLTLLLNDNLPRAVHHALRTLHEAPTHDRPAAYGAAARELTRAFDLTTDEVTALIGQR